MKNSYTAFYILLLLDVCFVFGESHPSEIELLGVVKIPGNAKDLSGLNGTLEDGTPQNQLGAFGSAITYTGSGNRYLAVADRGPKDGADQFKCRFHEFEIVIDPLGKSPPKVTLIRTTLLKDEKGENFIGASSAFDSTNSPAGLRLDPEGIAIGQNETVFIADEYGPFIDEFTPAGRQLRSLETPSLLLIKTPCASKKDEIAANTSGRRSNKGFEGLTISPDKTKLYALLQGPLLQDHAPICRLLELDINTGKNRQFAVPLTHRKNGFNEILAINDHEFLVIERDDEKGQDARFKKIMKIDIDGATDIQNIFALPNQLPAAIKPVKKEPWLDFLEPKFNLAGKSFPEKIEGLTFGPSLPDGRRILVVTTDNDCKINCPNEFWIFAVPALQQ
jgi:hypothetical protein